jgi:hypothetical protein
MTHPMSENGDDTVWVSPDGVQRPLLIGRDQELARVKTILEQGRPAVVVVSAATGMGKTSLLREIHARASALGWHTAYGDSGSELSVVPTTTEDTFRQWVLTLLGSTTKESYFDSLTGQSQLDPPHSLVYHLRRRAPVLLVIDGYRPESTFAEWFTQSFIEDVKDAPEPVVVVVADQSGNVAELQSHANDVINLGLLDRQAVKRHFESVGRRIDPPMGAEELDTYVEAACKDPARLATLTRLLTLAKPAEGSTNPSASA